jgi:hypothetical protein
MGKMNQLSAEGVTDLTSYLIGRDANLVEHREWLANVLLQAGLLEVRDGVSGFWRGIEFISFYDILEGKDV